jgi:hypothetical protein
MDALGGVLLYLGLISAAAGAASLVRPLRFIGIRTRKKAFVALVLGFLGFTVGVCLPIKETRVEGVRTHLDEFAPVFQFSELHKAVISAPKDRVYAAIHAVTPEEIRFFRMLMWIRSLSAPPEHQPILHSFTSGWFLPLTDDGREIVFGRAARQGKALPPEQFNAPQHAPFLKIVMSFRVSDLDDTHCLVTTETRVYAAGTHMLRGFAAYWRMIRPGSGLIRRMWLRAIKLRAETGSAD